MVEKEKIQQLKEYCSFGEDRVYVLLAIARAKENEDYNNNSEPVIREIVDNEEELERKVEQLDYDVSRFDSKFRLYLSANARNTMDAFFQLRSDMDDWLKMRLNGNQGVSKKFKRVDSEFKSVLQKTQCKDETNFIFDIDNQPKEEAEKIQSELENHTEILMFQETPNGYHIVTEPFNYNELESEVEYELKKDGMIFIDFIG